MLRDRGTAYSKLGKYNKAIVDWEGAIELNSKIENELREKINEAKEKLK